MKYIKLLLLFFIFISINLHADDSGTLWVPNASYTSATLSPTPYTNDADDTETLSIAGATQLTVSISGSIEYQSSCLYDYVTITDASGTTYPRYCGDNINDTFTVNGDFIDLVFHSDYSVTKNGVTVSISASASTPPLINVPDDTIQAGVAYTYNLSSFVTPTDGDAISGYNATGLPAGLSIDTATGVISGTPTSTGIFTVTASATDKDGTSTDDFNITVTPNGFDDTYTVESDIQLSGNVVSNDIVSLQNVVLASNTSNGVVNLNPDGSFTYTSNPGYVGTDTFTYTLYGDYGTDTPVTVTINVISALVVAVDDTYNALPNATISGNLFSNDTGVSLTLVSNTLATLGTLSLNNDGSFTYTANAAGTETFSYIITNPSGNTSEANVTINIGTNYVTGIQPFTLINPANTRNIIGSYKIAGNTVMCLTELTDGYGGTCHGQTDYQLETSNRHVSKYIDIDSNSGTWNSTSSYIVLPNNYDQKGGKGIAWAGLFWQGRVSNATQHVMHYGLETSGGFNLVETGQGVNYGNVDLTTIEANKIRLKIDTGTYSQVTANTLYDIGTNNAKTYAAFADVTHVLQGANLASGKHTFTVANLTTNEGREESPGVFGGWSLVVIYLEDVLNGSPQNISIYSGFDSIGQNNAPIPITGFRLPSGGNSVTANLSLFSGEGEYRYGRTPTNNARDTIQMSSQQNTGYVDMPGASSPLNVFDGVLDGVLRDDIPGEFNNLQVNNDGVDVDNFDVSTLMTAYRDADPLIQTIYIKYFSDNDYITPSMIAFSTELYQPKICYDYTLDIDGYVLQSENNEVKTPFGAQGNLPLTTRVSIQSQEGDFPLQDVNITYRIADTNQLRYITDSTAIAPNGIYSYIPAGSTGLNQTYSQINSGFGMYIGEGASAVPGPGGVIGPFETRYFKFEDEMRQANIDTYFDMRIEYSVDYGSGPLNLTKNLDATSLCPSSGGYYPAYGNFNVSSDTASTGADFGQPYNLYTQVANKNFNAKVFSYDDDFTTPKAVNTSIEVEMYNAGHFNRDTNISCYNPDSNITFPQFVRFNSQSWANVNNINYAGAIRNAGFRTWNLTAPDGSFVAQTCTSRTDETCFQTLYTNDYTTDTLCTTACSSGGSGCYPCLRKYYGKPICSRDNFAVRPEAFVAELIDSNQTTDTNVPTVAIAHSRIPSALNLPIDANLSAGYEYRFDVNATNYINDNAVPGYHQQFNQFADGSSAHMLWSPGSRIVSGCNDTSDKNISITLFQGNSINTYQSPNQAIIDKVLQAGQYAFVLTDENWTSADWHPDYTQHHASSGFSTNLDCLLHNSSVVASGRNGCMTSSIHAHPNGTSYNALALRYFPYDYQLSLATGGQPTYNKNFVYINELNSSQYPNGIDEDVSYNITGSIRAKGYNNEVLSNFVSQCYADDTNMTIQYTYLSTVPNDTPNFTYDLDYNKTNPSPSTKSQIHTNNAQVINVENNLTIAHTSTRFLKSQQGTLGLDIGLNYDRTNDTPLNPRFIHFGDINITYAPNIRLSVEQRMNHEISNILGVDSNISFQYARVKPAKLFYDDVTADNVITPISIVVYCDLGYTECQNRGISALNGQTDEFDWWKAWDHDNQIDRDGNIELVSTPTSALNTTSASITAKGEDSAITVSKGSLALPATVPVNLVVNDPTTPAPALYTDRWLIYNPENATQAPSSFYRVRFIGAANWAGKGETGHVVGGNSNTKKSRRVEW